MLLTTTTIDDIASRIDFGLCDACGDIRMRDTLHDDDDRLPGAVIAERLGQVRQDIGELVTENRNSFAELDRRLQSVCEQVRNIQMERATEKGMMSGVKLTMGVIITMSTLLGSALTWIFSHLPWSSPRP